MNYTSKQLDFIGRARDADLPWAQIVDQFNKTFKTDKTENAIRFAFQRAGKPTPTQPSGRVILAVSDIQAPFQHIDTLDFLEAVKKKYAPDVHVNMGDEVDFHALSDYDPDPDGYSAGHELDKALEFMHGYYDLFPSAKVCISNHTIRPLKRAFKAGIPRAFLRTYSEFLQAPPGWEWSERWDIDGIAFEHGESFGGTRPHILHALANMRSTVIGHHHSVAGIEYYANEDVIIFGAASGCLIDNKAYAFKYGSKIKKKPILGLVVILNGIPHYVPMILKSNGRWDRTVR